jgi:hypothetical protein
MSKDPLESQPQIYLKLYYLIKELNEISRNLPKHHKYVLGENILKLSWTCLDYVIEANFYHSSQIKKEKISKLSLTFDKLKIRLRMLEELKLISKKRFYFLQINYIKTIGEMIGGWSKWVLKIEDN